MILTVFLEGEKIICQFWPAGRLISANNRKMLVGLDKLLKKEGIEIKKIKGIILIFGRATFTAARQAAAIINALAFVLKIKIVSAVGEDREKAIRQGLKLLPSRRPGKGVKPYYNRPPNITQPKIRQL